MAAAVILDDEREIAGLADSKKLSEKRREALYGEIIAKARSYAIAEATVEEIDSLNILHASMLAMKRAIESLDIRPTLALVDGNRCPKVDLSVRAIVGGDAIEPAISAASILAKVTRDRAMLAMHKLYPEYAFDKHKGYPTKLHRSLLREYGPCQIHRRSYRPVQEAENRSLYKSSQ